MRLGDVNIGYVLDRLSDDTWHDLDEISSNTNIKKTELTIIVEFFREFGFVEADSKGEKVKIDKGYLAIKA